MNFAARPWLVAVILGLLAMSLTTAHAGMTDTEVKAFESYKAQAEKGDKVAQFIVGLSYLTGSGVVENDFASTSWYRKAAEQGYAPAQFSLGYNYSNGLGVEPDQAKAASWYRKAAEQGFAEAQHNLGFFIPMALGWRRALSKQHLGIVRLLSRVMPRLNTISGCAMPRAKACRRTRSRPMLIGTLLA